MHLKSSKVCIITRSALASLLFKGLANKHTTVKWTIKLWLLQFLFVTAYMTAYLFQGKQFVNQDWSIDSEFLMFSFKCNPTLWESMLGTIMSKSGLLISFIWASISTMIICPFIYKNYLQTVVLITLSVVRVSTIFILSFLLVRTVVLTTHD